MYAANCNGFIIRFLSALTTVSIVQIEITLFMRPNTAIQIDFFIRLYHIPDIREFR